MSKKKVPEVNASSMADISFLLLIFFLVATTMSVDTGLQRVLPPITDKDQPMDVNQRNLLMINVSNFDGIFVRNESGQEAVDITQLKDRVKLFLQNPTNDPKLPDKEVKQIDIIGDHMVSKGVISLQNDRGTSYDMYLKVQNELTKAVNELRDELSRQKFQKNFMELDQEHRDAVSKAVPMQISEAEPRDIKGK